MQDQETTAAASDVMEYRHVRHKVGKREMAVTVCYHRVEEPGQSIHEIALAFCCPKDQFSRARGRRISSGRLLNAHCLRIDNKHEVISDEVFAKKTRFVRRHMTHPDSQVGVEDVMRIWFPEIDGPPWWVHSLRPVAMGRLAETFDMPF